MADNKLFKPPTVKISPPAYVRFSFLSPFTGKMKPFRWTFGANRLPEGERHAFLAKKCQQLHIALKSGFNPFVSDESYFDDYEAPGEPETSIPTLRHVFGESLALRQAYQKDNGFRTVKSIAKAFIEYLDKYGAADTPINKVSRSLITQYLNHITKKGRSNRTRNNHRRQLTTLFNDAIRDFDLETKNPVQNTILLPQKSETHVTYSTEQIEFIVKYCTAEDPYLLQFCRFIVYAFLRPIEIKALQIRNVDLKGRVINLPAEVHKTGERTDRLIQDVLFSAIEEMSLGDYPPDFFLFSETGKPGPEPVSRDFFTLKFKVIKELLGLTKVYTMYGMRHTFATDLIRSGAPWHHIMKITGHTTLAAFENYVKSIHAELPKDLSENYSIKF